MAISLQATGSWARMVTDGGTVAYPAGSANGDRAFIWGTWKDFSVTLSQNPGSNSWTPIETGFADGSVAAGNGTGSVKVACWYKDVVGAQTDPPIDYSVAPTEGHWVIQVWRKDASETWDTPLKTTAAIGASDPFSVGAATTVDIPDGAVVMALFGLRDDSTTIARGVDDIRDFPAVVTWNGNLVESPAAHFSSTTGLDMSGDLAHRFVTTGASGVSLVIEGDPVAAETGAALWVVQSVSAPPADSIPQNRQPRFANQAVPRASSWFRRHDGLLLPKRRLLAPA